jgi:uroporphyrinogen-III synthase
MPTLGGARVALLEARMSKELADLVERFGGRPYCVPAVREARLPPLEHVTAFIAALCAGRFSAVVLLTGVGVTALLREADSEGRLAETLNALRQTTTACRGPKPAAVLRRHDVPIGLSAAEPYTTRELLDALQAIDIDGKEVALVHYGERNSALADALEARGAELEELCLYEWVMPDDVEPLRRLVGELIDGRVDAVAFTSQVQCRHLFQVAADLGWSDELANALNSRIVVAAIGPVCAGALKTLGVTPRVLPAHPKMGPMIAALADYFELSNGGDMRRE